VALNRCYICQAEAVSRCYTCGRLICEKHGGESCDRCNTSVVAGDPRPLNISAEPVGGPGARPGWWRPLPAEEFDPPACYACGGLSRQVCFNCQSRFCGEHAGPGGLCADCGRSSRLGLLLFFIALGMMIALVFLGGFLNY
jgi:hypothetical protein